MPDNAWFVSYQPLGPSCGPQGYRRLSETFSNELDAKAFARKRLTDSCGITAGPSILIYPNASALTSPISTWIDPRAARSKHPAVNQLFTVTIGEILLS
jgi:hypothetical protein